MALDFPTHVHEAAERLARRSKVMAGVVGLIVVGLIVYRLLKSATPTEDLPFAAFPLLLGAGGAGALLWHGASQRKRLLAMAEKGATFFFASERSGLVAFNEEGAFVESRGSFYPYDSSRERLAGVAYLEEKHSLRLQVWRRYRDRNGVEHERTESVDVPLPKELAADVALQRALEANRRAQDAVV